MAEMSGCTSRAVDRHSPVGSYSARLGIVHVLSLDIGKCVCTCSVGVWELRASVGGVGGLQYGRRGDGLTNDMASETLWAGSQGMTRRREEHG